MLARTTGLPATGNVACPVLSGAARAYGRGMTPPFRVLVAGGGVAGLEALLALRDLAGDRAELTLLAPDDDFVYRPMAVAEPFSLGHRQHVPLADVARDVRARHVRDGL